MEPSSKQLKTGNKAGLFSKEGEEVKMVEEEEEEDFGEQQT